MDKGYPFKRYLDKYMMSIRYNVKQILKFRKLKRAK